MAKENPTTNKDTSTKHTTGIDVSNIPVKTLEKVDAKVSQLGITRSGYIKNLINADLNKDVK